MANWKAEVIADNSGKWCGNGLVFATKLEAEAYARDLFGRWTLVREWRAIQASKKQVNAVWVDGVGVKRLDVEVKQ